MTQSPNSLNIKRGTRHEGKTRREIRLIRWLLEACLVLGLLYLVHLYQTRNVTRGPAPAFSAQLLDGTRVSLEDFGGQPVLLQFWATWCPVCRLEQGGIDAIAQDYAVLSLALDDASVDDIRQWMQTEGVSYPVIRDPQGVIAGKFGVSAVPTSVILDANGKIRFVEVGYTTELGLRLRLWWISV